MSYVPGALLTTQPEHKALKPSEGEKSCPCDRPGAFGGWGRALCATCLCGTGLLLLREGEEVQSLQHPWDSQGYLLQFIK